MARIVVFDSGLGSLSIIKSIQKICKIEIIYFADQQNFPYGNKSKKQLEQIIKKSIELLEKKFNPELIVIGSNTPTIMLDITNERIIGVNPPLKEAVNKSRTKNIAILATETVIKSKNLSNYIINCKLSRKIKVHKINASNLIQLVESGKFIKNKKYCKKIIKNSLNDVFLKNNIDIVTLSSTHLSFLKTILEFEFPNIQFIDPADNIARKIFKKIKTKQSKRNLLRIFSSDKTKNFQSNLSKLGIKNKIKFLSI
ncbi:MAG: aspartate/glutamate racemase family protein [Thaumarchaeota archaeon]|nr:aspartate/glutamate racemase family protein [Nitrososphaerota archaeon]